MIITVKRSDSNFRRSYLLCLNSAIDKAVFLRRAKVKAGTYAGDLLANLHDGIFHRSIELKSDYTKYYALEYRTFAEYARKRFLLPFDVVGTTTSQVSRVGLIIYFHPSYSLFYNKDNSLLRQVLRGLYTKFEARCKARFLEDPGTTQIPFRPTHLRYRQSALEKQLSRLGPCKSQMIPIAFAVVSDSSSSSTHRS